MNARAAFRDLHRPGRPLLLPNAWDHASAAALAARGHPAVGTTSLGVAAAAGKPDAEGAIRAENVALARRLRDLPVPVSVDIEGGGSDDPAAVAEHVAELAALGVAGVNLEDGRPDGSLAPAELMAAKIAAVRAAAPDVFLNARTDAWWLGVPEPLPEALERARVYRDAGADGFFVPAAPDDLLPRLAAHAGRPLNVLYRPGGLSVPELGRLGVARVSTGSLLFRAALGAALHVAEVARTGREADAGRADVPAYEWVAGLSVPDSAGRRP